MRTSETLVIHPFYHTVSNRIPAYLSALYQPKSEKEFETDLDFMLSYFRPIGIYDFYSHISGNKQLKEHAFHLSFDDGLRGVYETALPILLRKGIPATLFVNSGFVDNKELFFRHKAALIIDKLNHTTISEATKKNITHILNLNSTNNIQTGILNIKYGHQAILDKIAQTLDMDFADYLTKERPYLTIEELKIVQEKGFTIGSHSIDHPRFSELDMNEKLRQTEESSAFVKKNFNEVHSFFSFPFSDENIESSFFEKLYENITLSFGITGMGTHYNDRHIDRIDMEKYGKNAREAVHKALLKYRIINQKKDSPDSESS